MAGRIGRAVVVLAVAAASVVVMSGPAGAVNVVTVSSTTDGAAGSLRDAFDTANSDGDDTVIELAAGTTYPLTICDTMGGDDTNAQGDLDHLEANDLTINGNGATIDQTCDDRVIDNNDVGTITLDNVTVTGGDEPQGNGGGLKSDDGGDVIVQNATTFSGNTTDVDGGAVSVENGAGLVATNATFTNNTAGDDAGAIYVPDGDAGVLEISDSTFTDNTAGDNGGAVFLGDLGTANVERSRFEGNTAGDDSGVWDNGAGATTRIAHSLFAGNTAAEEGGVAENDGGAPGQLVGGTLTIENSTLSDNTAVQGGAIDNDDLATVNLTNVTVVGNTTEDGAAIDNLPDNNDPTPPLVNLLNTIVANNTGGDCGGSQPITSLGYNIDGDDTCDLTAEGDQPATDPVLGGLADNGGPTRTHLPLEGSPAIDRGTNDGCPSDDQRGVSRPQDGTGDGTAICDVGAVEVEAPPSPTTTAPAAATTAPAAAPGAATPAAQPARATPATPAFTG